MARITIRTYGPLNDFVESELRQRPFEREVTLPSSVKDVIEGAGIPHPEIGAIVVNGEPRDFSALLAHRDRVAVYPFFDSIDDVALPRLRGALPSPPRFLLDTHLGKLARRLRLAGFDTLYANAADDADLAEQAARDGRVLLTRDVELLKRRAVEFGYFVRATDAHEQWLEVVSRFALVAHIRAFTRCTRCNGTLRVTTEPEALARVPADVLVRVSSAAAARPVRGDQMHEGDVYACSSCGHVYWEGSHTARIRAWLADGGAPKAGADR